LPGIDDASEISGIILAGGQSRRLGRDKALELIKGQSIIERVLDAIAQVCSETLVVVGDVSRGDSLPLKRDERVVVDHFPRKGPLGGIFSGITAANYQWSLVVACDMPFLNLVLLRHMISLRPGADAVVPMLDGRPQPTHALYYKSCAPVIEKRLLADDLKVSSFFDQVKVRHLSDREIAAYDPEGLSFFNVNTQEDLDRARSLEV
jgi:molybdopterin-guanine dinucleotide biosynthesis protein A